MNQKATTPDERFLMQLHKLANGEIGKPVSIARATKAAALKDTAVKNIIKHLAQANLVEKIGETHVALTARGLQLVEEL